MLPLKLFKRKISLKNPRNPTKTKVAVTAKTVAVQVTVTGLQVPAVAVAVALVPAVPAIANPVSVVNHSNIANTVTPVSPLPPGLTMETFTPVLILLMKTLRRMSLLKFVETEPTILSPPLSISET